MDKLRLPPQNSEAEKSVIGSILIDTEAIFKVIEFLEASHFYKSAHKAIYQSIVELFSKRKAIDVLTLTALLKKKKLFSKIGGSKYLSELVASVPTAAHIEEYGKLIREASIRRKIITFASEIDGMAYKEDEELVALLDNAERKLLSIAETSSESDFVHISKLLEEAI